MADEFQDLVREIHHESAIKGSGSSHPSVLPPGKARAIREELATKIDTGLVNSTKRPSDGSKGRAKPTPAEISAFRDGVHAAANSLSDVAAMHVSEQVDRVNLYPDQKSVARSLTSWFDFSGKNDRVMGYYTRKGTTSDGEDVQGTVNLSKGMSQQEWEKSVGKGFGPVPDQYGHAEQVYTHEMFHAIDNGTNISGSSAWKRAWGAELFAPGNNSIQRDAIGVYAAKNEVEGFAEYGRMVTYYPKAAKLLYPKCWELFHKNGLISPKSDAGEGAKRQLKPAGKKAKRLSEADGMMDDFYEWQMPVLFNKSYINDGVFGDGWSNESDESDAMSAVFGATVDALDSVVAAMVDREALEARQQAKNPAKFLAWLDGFYVEHAERMKKALAKPLRACELACGGLINLDSLVARHVESGKDRLLNAALVSSPTFATEIAEFVSGWKRTEIVDALYTATQPRDDHGRWSESGSDSGGWVADWKAHHANARLKSTIEKSIDRAIVKNGVSEANAKKYKSAVDHSLDSMTQTARNAVANRTTHMNFYDNEKDLTDTLRARNPDIHPDARIGAAYEPGTGRFHLDGNKEWMKSQKKSGTELHSGPLEHVYTHEMFHAIDGPYDYHSGSRAWRKAAAEELPTMHGIRALGPYALSDFSEAFAEFGRAATYHPEKLEKHFPRCMGYMRRNKLIK
jgi:hypothetical protein